MNTIICDNLNGRTHHGKSVKVKVGGIFTSALLFCVTPICRHLKSHLYLADCNCSKRARFPILSRTQGSSLFTVRWREQQGRGRAGLPRWDGGTLTDGQQRRQGIDKLSLRLKSDELHC